VREGFANFNVPQYAPEPSQTVAVPLGYITAVGRWAVGGGQWAVGGGQWAVGGGQWAVGSKIKETATRGPLFVANL
jgi:hypothetical protein